MHASAALRVRGAADLERQGLAVQAALAAGHHPTEDGQHGFRLQVNAGLALVVERPVEAADVQVKAHRTKVGVVARCDKPSGLGLNGHQEAGVSIVRTDPCSLALASWEPAMVGTPRLFRPELEMLGAAPGFQVIRERVAA